MAKIFRVSSKFVLPGLECSCGHFVEIKFARESAHVYHPFSAQSKFHKCRPFVVTFWFETVNT